jgi:hypothetical protein
MVAESIGTFARLSMHDGSRDKYIGKFRKFNRKPHNFEIVR